MFTAIILFVCTLAIFFASYAVKNIVATIAKGYNNCIQFFKSSTTSYQTPSTSQVRF